MAYKSLRMDLIDKIAELHLKEVPKKRIARLLGISRNTVKKYLELVGDVKAYLQLSGEKRYKKIRGDQINADRESTLKSLLPHINRELGRQGVTRQLLWEEYKAKHPDGFSYGRFCDRIRTYRTVQSATLRLEHEPGQYLMVDFAGKKVHWIDRNTGEQIPCEVLVCTLPYSGFTFACAVSSQKQDDFVHGINQALLYIGGLPRVILSDNLKSFVKKSDRYEPTFTDFCTQLAGHYGVELHATRVARPKDKASVERHVQLTYQRVYAPLRDRVFHSLEEINTAFIAQLDQLNARPMQGKSYSRTDKFEAEERLLLAPLPATLFERKKQTAAKVQRNYHVILGEDKHQYSVPYPYIGQRVHLLYTTSTVEVYCGMERIAIHKRDRRKHAYTTLPGHMPEKHRKYLRQRGWDADYFHKQARQIGPDTGWAMEQILASKQLIEQTYNSCLGVLRLKDKYGTERLEAACTRARSTHRVTYRILRNILTNGMDRLPLQEKQDLFTIPRHDNIRGAAQYE
jgi:transposase